MRHPHFLIRTASLASSILLFGGFVAYRANVFHGRSHAASAVSVPSDAIPVERSLGDPAPTAPNLNAIPGFDPAPGLTWFWCRNSADPSVNISEIASTTSDSTLMQSSKGGVVITAPLLPVLDEPSPTILSSSKSITVVSPTLVSPNKPASKPRQAAKQTQRAR